MALEHLSKETKRHKKYLITGMTGQWSSLELNFALETVFEGIFSQILLLTS